MSKVILAVYGVKITDRGHEQLVDNFGGNLDILKIFKDFLDDVFKNPRLVPGDKPSDPKRHVTTLRDSVKDDGDRAVYGTLIFGKNGEDMTVANIRNDAKVTSETPITADQFLRRQCFFYFSVPKTSKCGYLVIQRPSSKGVKELIVDLFREYWKGLGILKYTLKLSGMVNAKVFHKMMDSGAFKAISFTINGIPEHFEQLGNVDSKTERQKGKVHIIATGENLQWFKDISKRMFDHSRRKEANQGTDVSSTFEFDYEQYTEVGMTVELKGKTKTFHVRNMTRTQPDMDVTDDLPVGYGILDLVKQAKEMIEGVTLTVSSDDLKTRHNRRN